MLFWKLPFPTLSLEVLFLLIYAAWCIHSLYCVRSTAHKPHIDLDLLNFFPYLPICRFKKKSSFSSWKQSDGHRRSGLPPAASLSKRLQRLDRVRQKPGALEAAWNSIQVSRRSEGAHAGWATFSCLPTLLSQPAWLRPVLWYEMVPHDEAGSIPYI